jgi:hypothetical protein
MAVLGILLVLAAGAFLADVAVTNSIDTHLNMFGVTQNGMTTAWVFLFGAAAGFVLAIGLAMAISGMSRRSRRRRANRDALSQQRAETERLAAELERERRAREEITSARTSPAMSDRPVEPAMDDTATYPVETDRGAHAAPVDGTGTFEGQTDRTVVDRGVVRNDGTADPAIDRGMDGQGRHATTRDDRAGIRE